MELPEENKRALNLLMGWLYGQFSLHNLPVGDLDLLFLCADRMDLPRLRKEYVDVVFDWMTKHENKRYAGSKEKGPRTYNRDVCANVVRIKLSQIACGSYHLQSQT